MSKKMAKQNSQTSTTNKESDFQKPLTAIQNNFNITTNIDINSLTKLADVNSSLAERAMAIYETQLEYAKDIDDKILSLEKVNQEKEIEELPYIRKYSFRGQLYAALIAFGGLGTSIYFASLGAFVLAGVSITVPLGTLAVQFLKKK